MKAIVYDEDGERYSVHYSKVLSFSQSRCRRYTFAEVLVKGKVQKFSCEEDFWSLTDKIKRIGWKAILNDGGIKEGFWAL